MQTQTSSSRITAVFDTREHAQMALNELRQLGVQDNELQIIASQSHGDSAGNAGNGGDKLDDSKNVTSGTVAGMGVGALFGIAAALIPGVGPFITAGTLLTTALGAVGGGAVAGAVVGGTTGLIASSLAGAGYHDDEAKYYGSAVESGGTLLVVDAARLDSAGVREVLHRHGGRSAGV